MQKIVPAILTDSSAELQRQFGVLKDHTKWVQIDIMDGKFVPAVSLSISQVGDASQFFNLSVHLMVQDPEKYLEDCKGAGAKRVFFHLEGTDNPEKALSLMEQYSFQKGIAINPETSVQQLAPYLDKVDVVLLLSVVPGAQGHEFIPEAREKVKQIRALNSSVTIGMDGGINKENIEQIFSAGVDYVAVGSAIWKAQDPLSALRELEEMVS